MFHWLHHLLSPHCPLCKETEEENKVCASCETLKMQLAIVNDEKRQMLSTILSFSKPAEQQSPPVDYESLKPKMMTWNIRRQMMEAEDRKAAQLLAEQRKAEKERIKDAVTNAEKEYVKDSIARLEKELSVEEEVKPDVRSIR
jgi:hypothetical protein